MSLTPEELQARKDQAIALRNKRFLQEVEYLVVLMAQAFEKMNSIALLVSVTPELAQLTDEHLAELERHYDAAKLAGALGALEDVRSSAIANNWTAGIMSIYTPS